jgi:2-hydroxychromene-2-carboxylate isomerase
MNKTIEFFWDAASSYTYLASTQVEALAQRCGAQLVWKPFLLGKVFEATGNSPPINVPAKGKHLVQDMQRWAGHYGIPFQFPTVFPVNSVAALRVACALPAAQHATWAKAVLRHYWALDQDISQPGVLKAIAAELKLDGDKLLAATQDQAIKDQLRANTDEAVKRGVFGAPVFFVGEQMFWGNDRLLLLEEFLNGKLAA